MTDHRWHELTYMEISALYKQLEAERDEWRKIADELAESIWAVLQKPSPAWIAWRYAKECEQGLHGHWPH